MLQRPIRDAFVCGPFSRARGPSKAGLPATDSENYDDCFALFVFLCARFAGHVQSTIRPIVSQIKALQQYQKKKIKALQRTRILDKWR
jgi:hypothetical protein